MNKFHSLYDCLPMTYKLGYTRRVKRLNLVNNTMIDGIQLYREWKDWMMPDKDIIYKGGYQTTEYYFAWIIKNQKIDTSRFIHKVFIIS